MLRGPAPAPARAQVGVGAKKAPSPREQGSEDQRRWRGGGVSTEEKSIPGHKDRLTGARQGGAVSATSPPSWNRRGHMLGGPKVSWNCEVQGLLSSGPVSPRFPEPWAQGGHLTKGSHLCSPPFCKDTSPQLMS